MSKISSGIKSLDLLIDSINIGDNVVWEIDAGTSYEVFVRSFIKQSFEDRQKVIYISFNRSPQSILNEIQRIINAENFVLLDCFTSGKGRNDATFLKFYNKSNDVKVIRSDAPQDIKTFTALLNDLEDSFPSGARYIFDSLTGMQDLWGDEHDTYKFFTYMCPRLFDLETVAYWLLEKEAHSSNFKANLRHITQDVFELYVRRDKQYIKALKLAGRQNREAFKPHGYEIIDEAIHIIPQNRDTLSDLGAKIRETRNKIGLSQKDLADKMDVTPSFISQLENNQISPSLKSFLHMCRVLDVNASQFLDNEKTPTTPNIFRHKNILSNLSPSQDGTFGCNIFSAEKMSARLMLIPSQSTINGHIHTNHPEFIHVNRGSVSVLFKDKKEFLDLGDSIYISDMLPVQWQNEGGEEAELLIIW